jgi:hypothetical protein
MILLKKKKKIFNLYLYNINIKYNYNIFILKGYFGLIKIFIYYDFIFLKNLKKKIYNANNEINNG